MASYGSTIHVGFANQTAWWLSPWKTNMEPENEALEEEIPIRNHHFQVPCYIVFGGVDLASQKNSNGQVMNILFKGTAGSITWSDCNMSILDLLKAVRKRVNSYSTTNLRKFQQTPGTYPRYPNIQIWKDFLHTHLIEGLGYVPGVCSSFLRTKQERIQKPLTHLAAQDAYCWCSCRPLVMIDFTTVIPSEYTPEI